MKTTEFNGILAGIVGDVQMFILYDLGGTIHQILHLIFQGYQRSSKS